MTHVWLVRYDTQIYLFKDLDTVQVSVRDMYDTSYFVEKEVMSDVAVVFQIMKNGRVQDRIAAGLFNVYEQPTVIHRTSDVVENEDYDRPPQKPPRQEF